MLHVCEEEGLNSIVFTGSTDFGNVTFVVPGIHPYFYIGSKALNHTEEYTVASGMSHENTHQGPYAFKYVHPQS